MPTPEVILGNSNSRFSGVTSTMLATLPEISQQLSLAILGRHHLPAGTPHLSYAQFIKLCRRPLPNGRPRVFHARRNDEMIQALVAKKIFACKLHIIFTSTAQRQHSWLTKWLISQMDGLLTTCSGAAAVLERPADATIPHGVDPEEFFPPRDKTQAWKDLGHGGEYGIGIFGRIRPQKGIDLLIDAAIPLLKEDPKPTIVILGETTPRFRDYQSQLQEKINQAGLRERILFLGKRPFSEVKTYFRAVSLVAALSRNEGFGLTVLEALASGCAVLASEAGAWKEIVQDGVHGRIVPVDHLEKTRQALMTLLDHPEQLPLMGQEGRKHITNHYTVQKEAAALVGFYKKWITDSED